jgi:hypothetical protein
VAIATSNLLMEGKHASTSQVEGAWIFTPPINSTKGLNRFTNNNTQTFRHVSLPKGLNSAKKQNG